MKSFTIAVGLLLIILLSSCATSYKPRGSFSGGYSSIQISDNTFTVSFAGNGSTSRERATDFALLRSAELTVEKGFKYFIITDSTEYLEESVYTTPVRVENTADTSGKKTTATTTISGGETFYTSEPRISNTIIAFKEKPTTESVVYNPIFIITSVRSKYNLP